MKKYEREQSIFSACGLNCGLCPRFHTKGDSRCPGCAGKNFFEKHPGCSVLKCNIKNDTQFCFECNDFLCKKIRNIEDKDSFIAHNQLKNFERIKANGLDEYMCILKSKIAILIKLLNEYNDGRKKGFYCLAMNLLELDDLNNIMNQVEQKIIKEQSIKEKAEKVAEIIKQKAKERQINLNLNK